jgi:phage shock protein PspC (stress-responsive transcriptional regulator)
VVSGVAGGLARHLGIDPLLTRIVLVVLTIAFPPTLIGYLAAWALVPADGAPESDGENRNRIVAVVLVGLLVVLAFPVVMGFGLLAGPPVLGVGVPLLLLAGIVWLVVRVLGAEGGGSGRRIAAAAGIVLLALTGFFAALTAAVLGAGWLVAAIVIVCGVALMAAAFAGGARWLLAPALLLALPLAGVAAADVKLDGGVGEREYRPASVEDLRAVYEVGIGSLTVDLRGVDFPPGDTRVRIDAGMAEVQVLLPRDVCVAPDVHMSAGEARIGDRLHSGVGVDWHESPAAPPGTPRVILDADIGIGEIRAHTSALPGGGFDGDDEVDLGMDESVACA